MGISFRYLVHILTKASCAAASTENLSSISCARSSAEILTKGTCRIYPSISPSCSLQHCLGSLAGIVFRHGALGLVDIVCICIVCIARLSCKLFCHPAGFVVEIDPQKRATPIFLKRRPVQESDVHSTVWPLSRIISRRAIAEFPFQFTSFRNNTILLLSPPKNHSQGISFSHAD